MKSGKEEELAIIETLTRFENTGIILSIDALSKVSGVDYVMAGHCINGLIGKNYVVVLKGEHIVTTKGQQYYQDQCIKRGTKDTSAFKDEALTGMRQERSDNSGFMVSVQSDMERAVLSTVSGRIERGKNPEEIAAAMQDRRRAIEYIRQSLGLSKALYKEMMKEGRIRVCNGIDGKHIGIFDRKGNRYQHLCRDCFKEYRKGRDSVRGNRGRE